MALMPKPTPMNKHTNAAGNSFKIIIPNDATKNKFPMMIKIILATIVLA